MLNKLQNDRFRGFIAAFKRRLLEECAKRMAAENPRKEVLIVRSLSAGQLLTYLHGSRTAHSEYARRIVIASRLGAFRTMRGSAQQWAI